MNKPKQITQVLDYLEQIGPITPAVALSELGIARLAARINDLRNLGWHIETEMIHVRNRLGDPCHVARYRLVGFYNDGTKGPHES